MGKSQSSPDVLLVVHIHCPNQVVLAKNQPSGWMMRSSKSSKRRGTNGSNSWVLASINWRLTQDLLIPARLGHLGNDPAIVETLCIRISRRRGVPRDIAGKTMSYNPSLDMLQIILNLIGHMPGYHFNPNFVMIHLWGFLLFDKMTQTDFNEYA
jgi:hypothetical protein